MISNAVLNDGHAEFYSVGEMASFFDLSRQTLIYYDKIGLFNPARVNEDGHRLYTATQIPSLRLICLLKDLGIELKEIAEVVNTRDIAGLIEYLESRGAEVDETLERLAAQRRLIDARLDFYREVEHWRNLIGSPVIKQFDEWLVVCAPFPDAGTIDRSVLHPTLMKSMQKVRSASGGVPVKGFGTYLISNSGESGSDEGCEAMGGYRPAGTFTVVPPGVDPAGLRDVTMLPKGLYACMSYWGMPYQQYGWSRLTKWLQEHNFEPLGNAFDFCLLDASLYNDLHQQDLCCIQVMLKV